MTEKRQRILYFEDDCEWLDLIRLILEPRDFEVIVAESDYLDNARLTQGCTL